MDYGNTKTAKHAVKMSVFRMLKLDTIRKRKSELRSCVKVEVAVLSSPSLIILMVSVDVKHERRSK